MPMRILIIGPTHTGGSIPPYLDVLTDALRAAGAHVDRLGSNGPPYDTRQGAFWEAGRIIDAADTLLAQTDLNAYDVLSVHFGNLEIEQLFPARWAAKTRPSAVYHAHSLDWTLFSHHVPDPRLRAAVSTGVRAMDGYIAFGHYGARALKSLCTPAAPAVVTYLPTTIPGPAGPPVPDPGGTPVVSLYGYPAPWKDIANLLDALTLTRHPMHMHLRGPFWNDPAQTGVPLTPGTTRHGQAHLTVHPHYVGAQERADLIDASTTAVFPYRTQSTFQGSGAIADYLARGVPVIATDVANMAELIGDAGVLVPSADPAALASALDSLTEDPARRAHLRAVAALRAPLFQADVHAAACLHLYQQVLDSHR